MILLSTIFTNIVTSVYCRCYLFVLQSVWILFSPDASQLVICGIINCFLK